MTFDPLATSGVLASPLGQAGRAHAFVPSRLRILDALAANASDARGWILLTGEAGTGKSLVLEALSQRLPTGWEAALVELSPESSPVSVYEALAEALGERLDPAPDHLRPIRRALARAAADSRRLVLLIDEGQNASDHVLEALRLLAGRIGQDDGLAALVVSGQTPLLGRLSMARHLSIRNRLAAHIHLQGLDLAESATLLRLAMPGRAYTAGELEDLHRRLLGNPRLLIRLAGSAPARAASAPPLAQPTRDEPDPPARAIRPLIPEPTEDRRPPLRFEEGLIEVGFPDQEAEPAIQEPAIATMPEPAEAGEILDLAGPTVVSDPYADIQSRMEWEQLRGRITVPARPQVVVGPEMEPQAIGKATRIRAENPHEPRPHSRLFSRMESGPQADDETA